MPAKERPSFSLPEDVFFLTGRHTCEAVLRYQPKRVRHLYILDGGKGLDLHLKLAQGIRCRISFMSRHELDQRAPDLQHQGVILEVEAYPTVDMEDLPRSSPLWVGLDGVQDPRIRCCGSGLLCVWCGWFVYPQKPCCPSNTRYGKDCGGCFITSPVAQVTNLRRAMDLRVKRGFGS